MMQDYMMNSCSYSDGGRRRCLQRMQKQQQNHHHHPHHEQQQNIVKWCRYSNNNKHYFSTNISSLVIIITQYYLVLFVSGHGMAPPDTSWIASGNYVSVTHQRYQRRRLLQQQQQQVQQYPLHKSHWNNTSNNDDNDNMNDSRTYIAKYISTEYCRYMTDIDCQKEDEYAKQTTILQKSTISNNVVSNKNKVGPVTEYHTAVRMYYQQLSDSDNNNNKSIVNKTLVHNNFILEQKQILRRKLKEQRRTRKLEASPSILSNKKVLVLLVRFKGHENRIVPTKEYFNTILNGDSKDSNSTSTVHINDTQTTQTTTTTNSSSNTNRIGSMKDWLRYNSLEKYSVSFTIQDWIVSNQTEYETANSQSGLIGASKLQSFFASVLTKIDSSIQWVNDNYVDEFGTIYHLIIIHSGYAAESGPLTSCKSKVNGGGTIDALLTTETVPENRIWSQGHTGTVTPWISKDFYTINSYAVISAYDTSPTCSSGTIVPIQIGQIIHEYHHGFGLPDLYDQETTGIGSHPLLTLGGTGKFSIMSNMFGWNRNAAIPGHHDPWSRIKLDWLIPIEITTNGYYSIQPSEISGQVYILNYNFPLNEYILIENRQSILWDSDIDTGGIVLYHIDENQNGQSERGIPDDPSTNFPLRHYMVSIIQADRQYDIERGTNIGDVTDFWTSNTTKNSSLTSGGEFPNTDSIRFGERKATGLSITITSSSKFIMTFRIDGIIAETTNTTRTTTNGTQRSIPDNDTVPTKTTSSTIKWILQMLLGTATMIGVLVLLFVL